MTYFYTYYIHIYTKQTKQLYPKRKIKMIDFNALIAQAQETHPTTLVRTYVDKTGRKYNVELHTEGVYSVVRQDDGFMYVPVAYSASMCFLLCESQGLVEEKPVVVAQAETVATIDDEIKVLEEKLASLKAEKQATIDAVEIKSGEMDINGYTVETKVSRNGVTWVSISKPFGGLLGSSQGMSVFLNAITEKTKFLDMVRIIRSATDTQDLVDRMGAIQQNSENLWFVSLSNDQYSVSVHADSVSGCGFDTQDEYNAPEGQLTNLTQAREWIQENMAEMWVEFLASGSKEDAFTLMQIAVDCGCTEIESDEYEFSEDDAWKIWE